MIWIDADNNSLDKKVHSFCSPLFASSMFLLNGHDSSKTSATVTFFKYKDKFYAVTCHHVLAAFQKIVIETGPLVNPSFHNGRTVISFSHYGPNGSNRWSFTSCRDFPGAEELKDPEAMERLSNSNRDRPDIAVADVTAIWPSFSLGRTIEAIDLNEWDVPDWTVTQSTWLAFGFPDKHKYDSDGHVSAPLTRVCAELVSSNPSPGKPNFQLFSELRESHGWGFSGISGGPAFALHTTGDKAAFVGIIYEGSPSDATAEPEEGTFVRPTDISLKGLYITPEIFAQWLSEARFGVDFGGGAADIILQPPNQSTTA